MDTSSSRNPRFLGQANSLKIFTFGTLHVDTQQRILYNGSDLVVLPPKAVEILLVLMANPGQVVSREALRQHVWPDSFIEDANLSNNISLLRAALRPILGDADPIRTIPRRGYQLIAPVTETEVDEPQLTAIPGPEAGPPQSGALAEIPAKRKGLRYGRPLAITAVVVALIAGGLLARTYVRHRKALAAQPTTRPSLAVLEFKNLSDQPSQDWLGTAMQESLGADLTDTNGVRLISGLRVAEAERDLHLAPLRAYDQATLQLVGKRLDTGLAITGFYLPLADKIRLDLQLRDTRTGTVVGAFSRIATQADLFQAITDASIVFRANIGLPPAQGTDAQDITALSTSADGMHSYAEGLRLLRDDKPNEAQPLLSKAVLASPQSPLAHSQLAEAWHQLGFADNAESEARLALQMASALPKEEKLDLQARAYMILHDWPNALKTYTELHTVYPDNLDYVLGLANALLESTQNQQAMKVLQDAGRNLPGAASDPRLSETEANVTEQTSDWRALLLYSGEEIRLAQLKLAPGLEGDGLLGDGDAWFRLGDWDRALADYRRAEEISTQIGDNLTLGGAIAGQAAIQQSRGDPRAVATARRSLAVFAALGNPKESWTTWNTLGNALWDAGDAAGARAAYQSSADIALAAHSPRQAATAYINIARLCAKTGDDDCTVRTAQMALKLAQKTGDLDTQTYALDNLSGEEMNRGNFGQARTDLQQAMQIAQFTSDVSRKANLLKAMESLELNAGNLSIAQQLSDQVDALNALPTRDANWSKVEEATLHIAEGRPELVEAPMTELTQKFNTAFPLVDAWQLLAESWLNRGELAKARAAINRATELAKTLPDADNDANVLPLVASRIDAAEGHPDKALAALPAQLKDAKSDKDLNRQFKIRLAQGEIQAQIGNLRRSSLTLKALEADASKAGFGLIVQQARSAEAHTQTLSAVAPPQPHP